MDQDEKSIGLHRKCTDKFYTKPEAVSACMQLWRRHIHINAERDGILEPSAGAGAFVESLKYICRTHLFMDLHPAHADVQQGDFLTFRLEDHALLHAAANVHVVGNPPFGRQGSLAHGFLKTAMAFAKTVSFILPRSFKKQSQQDRIDRRFHLVASMDLSEDSFVIDGVDHGVPCVFQVWERRDALRLPNARLHPTSFAFVKHTEPHDVAFRRVGAHAGHVFRETGDKSSSSHYFLRFTNGRSIEDNYRHLCTLVFPHGNTTGPRSISQQDLLRAWECAEA